MDSMAAISVSSETEATVSSAAGGVSAAPSASASVLSAVTDSELSSGSSTESSGTTKEFSSKDPLLDSSLELSLAVYVQVLGYANQLNPAANDTVAVNPASVLDVLHADGLSTAVG
jgi:hypothetical protein